MDVEGAITSRRAKFIFVNFLPDAAPVMMRARAGGHKGELKHVLVSSHVDIQIEEVEELTEEDIITRFLKKKFEKERRWLMVGYLMDCSFMTNVNCS